MAKTLLSMQDLRWRALAEIRNQPGCSDVQSIAINRVSDPYAESNWSLCVLSAGARRRQHLGARSTKCPTRVATKLQSNGGLTALSPQNEKPASGRSAWFSSHRSKPEKTMQGARIHSSSFGACAARGSLRRADEVIE